MTTRTIDATQSELITGEQLAQMGDIGPCELIDGRIVEMTPTSGGHAMLEIKLGRWLDEFVEEHDLGWVAGGEVGIYIQRNPDRIRAADVAFISKNRLPEPPGAGYLTVAPNLIIEVISPHDSWSHIQQKIEEYFAIGVEQVWLVEPKTRAVYVYDSPTDSQKLDETQTLAGQGALAGFELSIKTLFSYVKGDA